MDCAINPLMQKPKRGAQIQIGLTLDPGGVTGPTACAREARPETDDVANGAKPRWAHLSRQNSIVSGLDCSRFFALGWLRRVCGPNASHGGTRGRGDVVVATEE